MNTYVPKVGDKVKATLGENVLVGAVRHSGQVGVGFVPEGTDTTYQLFIADGWHFELVVSVPTKFGAVIRRADGVTLTLQDPIHEGHLRWLAADSWGWSGDAHATAGGFTVLFEGVDE